MSINQSRDEVSARTFVVAALVLVGTAAYLRITFANFGFFSDGDQSAIAYGVELLVRGAKGGMYNYPEQLGYYETARFLFNVFGSSLVEIRDICVAINVTASVGLSALVLFLFPDQLTRRSRLLASGFLLVSPLLWKLSQYGNTALPSAFFVVAAFVAASRAGRVRTAVALACWVTALTFRADAVLVAPALAMWFAVRPSGSWKQGGLALAAMVAVFVALKAAVNYSTNYPSASDSLLDVMFNLTQRGRYLAHIYWGIGPVVLGFVAAGWPQIGKLLIWKCLALWVAAPFVFYFAWSTTPRYCMLLVVPAALTAACGFDALWRGLATSHVCIRILGRTLALLIALAPLQFTMSDAMPGDLNDWQKPGTYQAGDGPHYYGALLNSRSLAKARRGLPIDAAAQQLVAAVKEHPNQYASWIVIVDYWDDIQVSNFYLASEKSKSHAEEHDFIVKHGAMTIQFIMQRDALSSLQASEAGRRMLAKLSGAHRVFRVLRPETKPTDKVTDLLVSGLGVKVIAEPDSNLVELKFPPLKQPKPDSRGTSKPATRPTSGPTSRAAGSNSGSERPSTRTGGR